MADRVSAVAVLKDAAPKGVVRMARLLARVIVVRKAADRKVVVLMVRRVMVNVDLKDAPVMTIDRPHRVMGSVVITNDEIVPGRRPRNNPFNLCPTGGLNPSRDHVPPGSQVCDPGGTAFRRTNPKQCSPLAGDTALS